jgi:purine catabolism regulator
MEAIADVRADTVLVASSGSHRVDAATREKAGIMALTVDDLAHDTNLGLLLRVEGSPAAMQREILWSHPTELINPQMFSQSNEIVVTSGAMIPRRTRSNAHVADEAARVFIDNLTAAHVCALAFGTRLLHKTIPQTLLDYARRRDLPVLEIPIEVPFSLVMNAVAHGVESQEGMQLRQWHADMRNLVQAASSQDPIRQMTLNLATSIGGWCVLLTPYGSVAESSHLSARTRALAVMAATARGDDPAAGSRSDGDYVRIQELHSPDGTGLGTLVMGSRTAPTEFDDTLIVFAVSLFRLALFRRHGQDETLHQMRGIAMRKVFEGGASALRDFARPLWDCDMPREPLRVIAIHGSQEELSSIAAEISPVRRSGSGPIDRIFGQVDASLWIVTAAHAYRRMAKALSVTYRVGMGISDTCDWRGIHEAKRQALVAASRAEVLVDAHGRSPTPYATAASELGKAAPRGRIIRFDAMSPVLSSDSVVSAIDTEVTHAMVAALGRRSDELSRTVLIWLTQLCNSDRTAKLLGIHRHTLTKRLHDAEEALGRSLNDPQTRAELWLALNEECVRPVGTAGSAGSAGSTP